jgi:hypothetical protein
MSGRLVPCPSCSRHVRPAEASCPFCLAAWPEAPSALPALAPPPPGLDRAGIARYGSRATKALVGAAIVGAAALAGACSEEVGIYPPYGASPPCQEFDACGGAGEDNVFVLADATVGEGGQLEASSEAAEDVSVFQDGGPPVDALSEAAGDEQDLDGGLGDEGAVDASPGDAGPGDGAPTDAGAGEAALDGAVEAATPPGDASPDAVAPPADGSSDVVSPPADSASDAGTPPADGSSEAASPPADGASDASGSTPDGSPSDAPHG